MNYIPQPEYWPIIYRRQNTRSIQLNEELWYTPPVMPKKSEILFHDLKKKDQYWRRPDDLPKIFWDWNESVQINQDITEYDEDSGALITLSVEDTQTLFNLREREMQRRQHGIWFYNDGEPVYLTGNNYFFLMYCYMPSFGYPEFREFQRDVFYVLQLMFGGDNTGAYFQKAKKTGLTQIVVSVFANEATMIAERSFGFMNKTQDEANDLNMVLFNAIYEKMPAIMAPKISKQSENRIIFGKPSVKFTSNIKSIAKIAQNRLIKALNTWIFTSPTTVEPKFDGPKMYLIQLDEFAKLKISAKALYAKVVETVKLQQTIIGKVIITCYPPEKDSPSFFEAKEIYYQSKLTTIVDGRLGRTASGMICYFVGALVSTDGTFDKYGRADQTEALRRNQAERDNCKDAVELQDKIRQYPRNEEESWRAGGAGSTFDTVHLAQGKELTEKIERAGVNYYVDVNLQWERGRFSRVTYTPVTEQQKKENKTKGWWRIWEMPAQSDLNKIYKDENGEFTPASDTKHLGGVDVTEYVNTGDLANPKPSNNSITIGSMFDVKRDTMMGRPASRKPIITYNGRKEDANDFIEDLILTIFFTGAYVLIEANKRWVLTKMKELKLQNFLLVRQNDGTIQPFKYGEANMSVSTTKQLINDMCRLGNAYLKYPQIEGEVDYCINLKILSLYDQLMRFNPNRTQEFDEVMSFLYWLLAMEAFDAIKQLLFSQELQQEGLAAFGEYLLDRN